MQRSPNVCGANGTYTEGSSYQIAIHITGCNYSMYPPFSLYMHTRIELQPRARRLFSIVNLIIHIHRCADIAGSNSQRMLSQP